MSALSGQHVPGPAPCGRQAAARRGSHRTSDPHLHLYLSTLCLDTDKKWIVIDISRCVLPAPRYLVALKHFDEVFAPFCIDERFVPDNFDICNRRGGGGGEGMVPRLLPPRSQEQE